MGWPSPLKTRPSISSPTPKVSGSPRNRTPRLGDGEPRRAFEHLDDRRPSLAFEDHAEPHMARRVDHLDELVVPDVVDSLRRNERAGLLADADVFPPFRRLVFRHFPTVLLFEHLCDAAASSSAASSRIASIFSTSSFDTENFILMISDVTSSFFIW